MSSSELSDARAYLLGTAQRGTLIAGACTATFLLASAGLLDEKAATTSWWLAPFFRDRFPRVRLDSDRTMVEADGCVTAGAALAHVDLALWLVRRQSPALAAMVARYLLSEPRTSQASFMIPAHLSHADPIVERFEHWARAKLGDRFSLRAAARAAGASQRTLGRRLQSVMGKGPLSFLQDLRVEQAVHRLQTSDASVDEIASEVGYSDGVTLRTLIRRKTGQGVRQLRARAHAQT